jgi:hypothetical protein
MNAAPGFAITVLSTDVSLAPWYNLASKEIVNYNFHVGEEFSRHILNAWSKVYRPKIHNFTIDVQH